MSRIDEWLPSLQALRAFATAVRTESFADAGRALRLTHGAVSHHVAALERMVGAKLFERHGRGVKPTPVAKRLADQLTDALDVMKRALQETRRVGRNTVTLTLIPSLAQSWLLPRLSNFQSKHPTIDLCIRPTSALLDFDVEGIDLGVRYGAGRWKGLEASKLAPEHLFPVCSPDFQKRHVLKTAAQIAKCVLIRNPRQPWEPWLAAAGYPKPVEPERGPIVDDAGMAIGLAVRGHGIALARGQLAAADLAMGRLVRPTTIEIEDTFSYFLVKRSTTKVTGEVEAVAKWIMDEFKW